MAQQMAEQPEAASAPGRPASSSYAAPERDAATRQYASADEAQLAFEAELTALLDRWDVEACIMTRGPHAHPDQMYAAVQVRLGASGLYGVRRSTFDLPSTLRP